MRLRRRGLRLRLKGSNPCESTKRRTRRIDGGAWCELHETVYSWIHQGSGRKIRGWWRKTMREATVKHGRKDEMKELRNIGGKEGEEGRKKKGRKN